MMTPPECQYQGCDAPAKLAEQGARIANLERWVKSIDEKLDKLIAAANMGRGAWITLLRVGGLLVIIGGAVAWMWERMKP